MSAPTDTPDTPTTTTKAQPPRQRRRAVPAAEPDGYGKARAGFEKKAQQWLLARPDRTMQMPDDLAVVVGLGVPCKSCGASVYRNGDAGHTVSWKQEEESGGHWAAGITVNCA